MKKKLFLAALFCILAFSPLQAQSVYLPASHWIYPLLDRLATSGVITQLNKNTRPYTREYIAELLLNIEIDKSELHLSSIELELINRARGEFFDELNQQIPVESELERHLYSWKSNQQFAHFDLLLGSDYQNETGGTSEKTIQHSYYGGILRGEVFGLGFYSDNQIHSEWGGGPYQQHYTPSEGYPQSISDDSSQIIWDQSLSYLRLDVRGIQFEFGRNEINWGPSLFGGLMFSDQAPAMDLFRLQIPVGKAHFTWLHGKPASNFVQKWISAHRLEFSVNSDINIGVSESLIYGNRDIEWAYLNPVLPYLIAEHTLGDKDNLAIGLDVEWRIKNKIKLYGDFFIDDLFSPWEIFSNYWGNRLAFTLGGYWVDPLGLKNSSCCLEYTRLEPYVYTHEDSVNTYEHYDYSIGRQLHPNSDQWIFYMQKWFHRNVMVELQYTRTRHGAGERRRPHLESDGDKKQFLVGVVESSSKLAMNLTIQPYRDLFVQFYYQPVIQRNMDLIHNNNADLTIAGCLVKFNW